MLAGSGGFLIAGAVGCTTAGVEQAGTDCQEALDL
jgi:hypothetical protein